MRGFLEIKHVKRVGRIRNHVGSSRRVLRKAPSFMNAATPPSAATYGLAAKNLRNSRRAVEIEVGFSIMAAILAPPAII